MGKLVAKFGAIALAIAPASLPASTYEIRLFSTDDVMNVYITNSILKKKLILTDTFPGQSPYTFHNITKEVDNALSSNMLTLELLNGPQGYTYGYEFRIDGMTRAMDQCGTLNSFGCDNDRYLRGLVKLIKITFSKEGVSNITTRTLNGSAVPEPAVWVFMMLGVAAIGALMRRSRSIGFRHGTDKVSSAHVHV